MEHAAEFEQLSEEVMSGIFGGQRIADVISTACAVYGISTVISLAATGIGLPGAGTVGAFCAGWALGQLLF